MEQVSDVVLTPAPSFAPIAGASITVTDANGDPATLYAGNGTGQLLSHVLYSDTYGRYSFYAANGRYTLTIAATGYTTVARELVLFDRAQDQILDLEEFGSVDVTGVAAADSAVAAAIAWAQAESPVRGAVIVWPRGRVRLTSVAAITQRGLTLRGQGNIAEGSTQAGGTQLVIDHDSGAGIRISVADTRIESMTIGASDDRLNTAGGGVLAAPNVGIHVEGPDVGTGAAQMQRVRFTDVTVIRQPTHGVIHVGESASTHHTNLYCLYNEGHGLVFDRGSLTGRTYPSAPGIIRLDVCRLNDNGGHALAVGNPADTGLPAYRVEIANLEAYRNGANSSIMLEPYGTFLYGQNIIATACAFGARPTGATIGDPWTGGVAVAGRVIKLVGCRYINNDQPVRVRKYTAAGEPTRDVEIDGLHISSEGRTPFDTAVLVDDGCENVRVIAYADARDSNAQYVRPMALQGSGYWSEESAGIAADQKMVMRDFASSPQITLADDAVQELEFSGATGGILVLTQQNDSTANAMVAFRVAASGAYITDMVLGSDVVTGAGVLTSGTSDGTNAKFNIFVDNAGALKLYLKNRQGGERQFRITLLGVTAPRNALSTAF